MILQAIFYNNPDEYPPIVNSIRLMAQAGYDISIVCRDNGRQWSVTYPSRVHFIRLGARSSRSWREYLAFVIQTLRQTDRRAAVFIGHDMHGLLPARLLAWYFRRPLIYHCHDYTESGRPLSVGSRIVSLFERRFARTSDLMIVPDRERGAVVARELRLHQPPLVVANAPLNLRPQDGSALHQALVDRGFHFSRILLRQGRVGEGHALEMTIHSMPLWQCREWGMVVIGPGETAYIEHLREVAQLCGVAGQFAHLPPVGYDQVTTFTPGAQAGHGLYDPVNINHQYATTAANKIMEYMAAGLPLLVSDRPALRDLLLTYECGVYADERSPESIAAAVNTLLGNPEQARRMGGNGRKAFEEVFCYERQFAPVLEAVKRWNAPTLQRR
jgi:glycosyltransferase involved in cell wall biosynthesis